MDKAKYPRSMPIWVFLKNVIFKPYSPISFDGSYFDKYGDTFSVNLGILRVVCTRDPEIIQPVLKKSLKVFQKTQIQTKIFAKYMGKGLLTSTGDYWLQQRRLIQPAFHKEKIDSLIQIIEKAVDIELEFVNEEKETDIYPLMNMVAFKVVTAALFNLSISREKVKYLQSLIDETQQFLIYDMQLPHKKYWAKITGGYRKHDQNAKEIHEIVMDIINNRRRSDEQPGDLLDMLLEARYEDTGKGMEDVQIKDEVGVIMAAGYDTTAITLCYVMWELAKNPDKAQKVYEEVQKAKAESSSKLEYINALKYTKACLEETLRLYPPSWITDREPIDDTVIKGYKIKKGTLIGLSFYQLHRHPDYWEDPEVYEPERFYGKTFKEFSNIFAPFGAGPRMCIGAGFVFYEMLLVVAKLVDRYTVTSTTDKLELRPMVTLKPKEVPVRFIPRIKSHE